MVVTLVFLFPLAFLPVGDLIDTRRKRQARYDEFFTVRYARSIGRVVVESPLDRRPLNQWCSQGNKGAGELDATSSCGTLCRGLSPMSFFAELGGSGRTDLLVCTDVEVLLVKDMDLPFWCVPRCGSVACARW